MKMFGRTAIIVAVSSLLVMSSYCFAGLWKTTSWTLSGEAM